MRWLAVLPIKPLPAAKTRLRGVVPDAAHPELVVAMALDTVAAALGSDSITGVLVVCDDRAVREALTELGAQVVPDEPDAGLNAALAFAAARTTGAVAALTADLPALRVAELTAALRSAAEVSTRGYVPDAGGTGTVMLTAPGGVPLQPRFGPGSAAAHRASGAVDLRVAGVDWPTLRRDVDTADDLTAAVALGLGPRTAALLGAVCGTGT